MFGNSDTNATYILELTRKCNAYSLKKVTDLIGDPLNHSTALDFIQHTGRSFDIGLNLFTLISDQFRKENLHSDILKEILDPHGSHGEGDQFLLAFLKYLNEYPAGKKIKKENYKDAVVDREVSKIDIAIKDPRSKKAIIIENKINAAPDMPQQIPRYWRSLEKQGYQIDGVVYLILNGNKQPDPTSWTPEERELMMPDIMRVRVFDETPGDLYNGWLRRCEATGKNIDTVFLFRQYNKLISYIGGKNMNKPLMETFLTKMLENDNYETAHALKDMLDELVIYRRDKLIDEFNYRAHPFTRVGDWKNLAVIDHYFIENLSFAIDVIVTRSLYQVQFFERGYVQKNIIDIGGNPVDPLLAEANFAESFQNCGTRREKQFRFPEEEKEVYIFLRDFIDTLRKYNDKINTSA
ncbi:MAG: PD-(D/E)XK nuclease family protein [Bacteroidota bacterium]